MPSRLTIMSVGMNSSMLQEGGAVRGSECRICSPFNLILEAVSLKGYEGELYC